MASSSRIGAIGTSSFIRTGLSTVTVENRARTTPILRITSQWIVSLTIVIRGFWSSVQISGQIESVINSILLKQNYRQSTSFEVRGRNSIIRGASNCPIRKFVPVRLRLNSPNTGNPFYQNTSDAQLIKVRETGFALRCRHKNGSVIDRNFQ